MCVSKVSHNVTIIQKKYNKINKSILCNVFLFSFRHQNTTFSPRGTGFVAPNQKLAGQLEPICNH